MVRLASGALFWLIIVYAFVALLVELFGQSEGSLVFREPTLNCSDLISGRDYELLPVLCNESRRPIRVIGAGANCGSNGCVSVAGLPVEIAAGERHLLDVRFEAGVPGRFEQELPIYTDWPSQPYLVLRIEGVVRSGDPSDDREPTDE
ncbi:DUF1573 domain-containing protein [Tautonia sp. JC769]|uniref:DUF1573 domain-containing protein n=1 Tax=Tautonia sp. JC769 TaxID=3232135 RepID=UPI00345AE337